MAGKSRGARPSVQLNGGTNVLELCVALMLSCGDAHESPSSSVAAPIVVWIVDASDLAFGERDTMRDEIARIWSPAGVRVSWVRSVRVDNGEEPQLVVLLQTSFDPGQPLGAVQRVGTTFRRHVVVSAPALEGLLIASGVRPTDFRWQRLHARTFARVVSHELGHLLFESAEHTERGLMRPQLRVADVLSDQRDRFAVSPSQVLALHAMRTAAVDGSPRIAKP
jgi:hypothetical protein